SGRSTGFSGNVNRVRRLHVRTGVVLPLLFAFSTCSVARVCAAAVGVTALLIVGCSRSEPPLDPRDVSSTTALASNGGPGAESAAAAPLSACDEVRRRASRVRITSCIMIPAETKIRIEGVAERAEDVDDIRHMLAGGPWVHEQQKTKGGVAFT